MIGNLALYLLAVAMPVNLDEKTDDSLKRSWQNWDGFCFQFCFVDLEWRFALMLITLELWAGGLTPEVQGTQDLRSTGTIWSEPGTEIHLLLQGPDLRHLSLRLYLQGVFQDSEKKGDFIWDESKLFLNRLS